MPREEAEKDLNFAGFVVFECPLKADSLSTITTLKNSSHKVCFYPPHSPSFPHEEYKKCVSSINSNKKIAVSFVFRKWVNKDLALC